MKKINEATFFKSGKKTDEGNLKQMREGLRTFSIIIYLALS